MRRHLPLRKISALPALFALSLLLLLLAACGGGGGGGGGAAITAPPPPQAQTLAATQGDGTRINLIKDGSGTPSALIDAAGVRRSLGAPIASGLGAVQGILTIYMVTLSVHSRGIDIPPITATTALGRTATVTQLYRAPSHPRYAHYLLRHTPASGAPHYTHYLGGEFAAFGIRYRSNVARTVFHSGVSATAAYFSAALPAVDYLIPPGGAFGYYLFTDDGSLYLSSRSTGTLRVDFSAAVATLNVSLRNATGWYSYVLKDWGMSISADGRTFGNAHCRSAGGASAACSGTATFATHLFSFPFNIARHRNSRAITTRTQARAVKVNGTFYGDQAQEVAIAVWHWSRSETTIYVGILGRKAHSAASAGAAAAANAPDAAAAAASPPAADLATFPRAEIAAFTAIGGRMAHTGVRAPPPLLATLNHRAVYRIAAGRAGGVHTAANGARTTLANGGSGDEMRVDFAADTAVLDLAVGDPTGAHRYVLDDVGLELRADGGFNFCAACTGSMRGSGALSGFNSAAGLGIDGAFYGANAQEAAAVLRHTAEGGAGALEMGFVGVR